MDDRSRILVVEPKRAYLGVLARRLSEAGYRVTTSDSGASALAELHRAPVDLVLAELNMPRVGGAELARAIRGEAQWRDMPVVLITGRSDPKGMVRAYEAGADDVIVKPFHACRFEGERYDCGSAEGFVIANIAMALERGDIAPKVREFIAGR